MIEIHKRKALIFWLILMVVLIIWMAVRLTKNDIDQAASLNNLPIMQNERWLQTFRK